MFVTYLDDILAEIKTFQNSSNEYNVYRGQADSSWNLRPSLFVKQIQKKLSLREIQRIENNLFFEFTVNAKGILENKTTAWETLFKMRHYGLPTRLLDWTESLNTAIYFATYGQGDSPCIWILDPHKLNEISLKNPDIPNPLDPSDGIVDYSEAFISTRVPPTTYEKPFAIIAPRMSDRIFAQRGLFTIQTDTSSMIDEMPDLSICVKKIPLLRNGATKQDLKDYLKIMGINHFTIYPDFEGLRMTLLEDYNLE